MKKTKVWAFFTAFIIILNSFAVFAVEPDEYGDIDNNGKLEASDAAMVLQYVLKSTYTGISSEGIARAEVTGDGLVTAADAAAILQKVLKSTYIFPVLDNTTSDSAVSSSTVTVAEPTTKTTSEFTTESTTESTTETTTETTTAAPEAETSIPVVVNGNSYAIGQPESQLPKPTRKEQGIDGYMWYEYSDDLMHYVKVGVSEGKVSAIYTMAEGFSVGDYKDGMSLETSNQPILIDENTTLNLYRDNTTGKAYAMIMTDINYLPVSILNNETKATTNNQVFDMTNALRARNGAFALQKNPVLDNAANRYAAHMLENNFCDHVDPITGFKMDKRLDQFGIYWLTYGENLAKNYKSPEDVVNAWYNSAGHRANMLKTEWVSNGITYRYTYLGIGTAFSDTSDPKYNNRYVQYFYG